MEEKNKKEEKYIVEFSRPEIEDEIVDIQEHPNFKLALQVSDGQKKMDKYTKLVAILKAKEEEKDKK